MMRVTGRIWRAATVESTDVALTDVPTIVADADRLLWLDLTDPDDAAVTALAGALGIDASAVEDALGSHERVQLHRYAHYWSVIAYSATMDRDAAAQGHESRLVRSPVSAFVLPRALITIHDGGFDPATLAERWDDGQEDLALGVGTLLHAFLDVLVDGHFETLQVLDEVVDNTEDIVFSGKVDQNSFPQAIHQVRSELAELRRIVLPMREVVAAIQRHRLIAGELAAGRQVSPLLAHAALAPDAGPGGDTVVISPGLDPLFDDLYDHVLRATEWTDSLRDLVSSVFETNLSLQDARLNQVMKKLAGWAAVIAVPTAITGWFGQNIPYWGFGAISGLVASIVLIVGLSGGLYLILRHYDWI